MQLSSNVTQALESTEAANPTVLWDIEVFRDISPETELSNEYVEDLLESMRVLKNAMFFASITDGALDLYK
jgi:uncharacterized protein (TIGR04255 family)